MKDDKPILLVDNSNTRTKYALSSADGELCAPVRCLPTSQISPQRVRETLAGWSFGQVVLCSVVPTAAAVLSSIFAEWPLHCISHTDCPQLLRLYKNPACEGRIAWQMLRLWLSFSVCPHLLSIWVLPALLMPWSIWIKSRLCWAEL